jgi:hypothetical protein
LQPHYGVGSTQPLTEIIRNHPGGNGRPARKTDNLRKCGNLDVSQPYSPPLLFARIALFFYLSLWLRHYATNRKVAGSIPVEVIF